MSQLPPQPPNQQPKAKKPITKRWWFWLIAAIVLIGLLSRCGGGDDQATPAATPAPATTTSTQPPTTEAPAPTTEAPAEPAAPTPAELEAYVANGAGAKSYDEACINGISWMCDIESVDINGSNNIQVNVRNHNAHDANRRARAFFNFISEQGPIKRDDSPMPGLTHVQVVSMTGGDNGSYLHGFDR